MINVCIQGETDKYFISGGFALTHANSVTVISYYSSTALLYYVLYCVLCMQDVSVSEAFPLTDFDETAVKTGYAEALKSVNSDNASIKAAAAIEINVFQSIARALNFTL